MRPDFSIICFVLFIGLVSCSKDEAAKSPSRQSNNTSKTKAEEKASTPNKTTGSESQSLLGSCILQDAKAQSGANGIGCIDVYAASSMVDKIKDECVGYNSEWVTSTFKAGKCVLSEYNFSCETSSNLEGYIVKNVAYNKKANFDDTAYKAEKDQCAARDGIFKEF